MPFINPIQPKLEKVVPAFYTCLVNFSDFYNNEYQTSEIIEVVGNNPYNPRGLGSFKDFLEKTGYADTGLDNYAPEYTDWYTLPDSTFNPNFPQSYLATGTTPQPQETRRAFIIAPGYSLDTSKLYLFSDPSNNGQGYWSNSGYRIEQFIPTNAKGYYGTFYSVICPNNNGKFAIKVTPTNS